MTSFVKYQGLTIAWALFILIICNLPLGKVGSSPLFFEGFDKLVHCGLFFVSTVFLGNGIIRQQTVRNFTYKHIIAVFAASVLFGGLIELLQGYVFTWRSADWNDLFADTVGAGMAAFCIFMISNAIDNEK
jgi:VanZ family protein